MPKIVLASILTIERTSLATALGQQVRIVTSAAPSPPPSSSSNQTSNSVIVEITSFEANKVIT